MSLTDGSFGGKTRVDSWRIAALGEPHDVLEPAEVDVPAPGAKEVAIRVEAIGLNFLDVSFCRGAYPREAELPLVPGAEFAGVVEAVGSDVETVIAGARVAATSSDATGGFAGAAVVDADSVRRVLPEMPIEDAAALVVTYHSAFVSLIRRARLESDEWVLVHGAGGGVGTAAVQLARVGGAHVIATADSDEKLALCRDEGAEVVVDNRSHDFEQAVLDATDGRGADVVFDPVGGEVFTRSLRCAAFEARIIPIGWASGTRPELKAEDVLGRNLTVVGVAWGTGYPQQRPEVVDAVHEELLILYTRGAIRPVVPRVWEWKELPDAVQALADGDVVGKAVVRGPSRKGQKVSLETSFHDH